MDVYYYFLLLLFLSCLQNVVAIDVFTAFGAAVIGVGSYLLSPLLKPAYNTIGCATGTVECCKPPWITQDIYGLRRDLRTHLFGQHIVEQIVPAALAAQQNSPTKPLVMSFHGWPGSGKNYVVQFIAKNMFKKGDQSAFYHFFNGRTDFPREDKVLEYQENLRSYVTSNVTACEYSLFVFDEVDKMPKGVLDGIKPFLDHHMYINGVSYRNAVFIFLSNSGSNLIVQKYLDLWRKQGKSRLHMTLNDFDNVLGRSAFNEKGGLQMSDLIDHNLIDHYVPFLPMEKVHIELCIKAELNKRKQTSTPEIIDEVMKAVTFGPKPELLFSTSGCKRLSQKVSAIVERYKYVRTNLDDKA